MVWPAPWSLEEAPCGRHDGEVDLLDLEEVPLPGGIRQPFPPRAENVAAVEIELVAQFVDRLLLFLDGLSRGV